MVSMTLSQTLGRDGSSISTNTAQGTQTTLQQRKHSKQLNEHKNPTGFGDVVEEAPAPMEYDMSGAARHWSDADSSLEQAAAAVAATTGETPTATTARKLSVADRVAMFERPSTAIQASAGTEHAGTHGGGNAAQEKIGITVMCADGHTPLRSDELDKLCDFVDEERSTKDDRLAVLRELGGSHAKVFTCAQFARLLRALEIKSERMVAVEAIAPRVRDPQNAQAEILQFFRFAEEVRDYFYCLPRLSLSPN